MKRLFLLSLVLALVLTGCAPFQSGNTASDADTSSYTRTYSKDRVSDTDILSPRQNEVKLVDVNVDSRRWNTTTISPCPVVQTAGNNSCNIQFFTSQDALQEVLK